ncbi:MAG: MscL family protein [Flavobacteriales bacterium AspAUS03]
MVNFLIISFCIFLLTKAINKFYKKEEQVATLPAEERLLTEIRDLIKSKH